MPDVLTLLLSSSPFPTDFSLVCQLYCSDQKERANAEATNGLCFLFLFLFFKQDGTLREKKRLFQFHAAAKASRNNSNVGKKTNPQIKHRFLLSVASYDFPEVTVLILYACSGWWEM